MRNRRRSSVPPAVVQASRQSLGDGRRRLTDRRRSRARGGERGVPNTPLQFPASLSFYYLFVADREMLTYLHELLMIEFTRFGLARRGASCEGRATDSKRRGCFWEPDWRADGRATWIAKASCHRHATAVLARRDVVGTAGHALRGPDVRRDRGTLSVRVSLRPVMSKPEATARGRVVRPAHRVRVCLRGLRVCPEQRGIHVYRDRYLIWA